MHTTRLPSSAGRADIKRLEFDRPGLLVITELAFVLRGSLGKCPGPGSLWLPDPRLPSPEQCNLSIHKWPLLLSFAYAMQGGMSICSHDSWSCPSGRALSIPFFGPLLSMDQQLSLQPVKLSGRMLGIVPSDCPRVLWAMSFHSPPPCGRPERWREMCAP